MLQVSDIALQQVVKHLGVVFTSSGRKNKEIDTRIGKANVVLPELYRSVVAKREFLLTAKLAIKILNRSSSQSSSTVMNLG